MNSEGLKTENKTEFLIVTGLSGSGKSSAVKVLEDIGFFCVDNMPPQLISKFAEICTAGDIKRVAIVTDIRGGGLFLKLNDCIAQLQIEGYNVKVLFLDCDNEVLVRRYKETRRKHPLDGKFDGDIVQSVAAEREMLLGIKEVADYYVDTSLTDTAQFKKTISEIFLENLSDGMLINCISFGYKHGIPNSADLVFDVRCLPNPFYIPELKHKTGIDAEVSGFVMKSEKSQALRDKINDFLDFVIPMYVYEGKSQLVIAFGCTGGHHRSVTFANNAHLFLSSKGLKVRLLHRDILK